MSGYRDPRDIDPRDRDPRNRDNEERPTPAPAFNVSLPFKRLIMIQINPAMRDLLVEFFDELIDNDTEEEIAAFKEALVDQSIYMLSQNFDEPSFLICEQFLNVLVLQINEAMRNMLVSFFNEIEDLEQELFAFSQALADPIESLRIRLKTLARSQDRKPEPEERKFSPKVRRRKLTMA